MLLSFTDSLLLSRSQETQLRQQDQRYRIAVDSVWWHLAATIVALPEHDDPTTALNQVVGAPDSVWVLRKQEQSAVRGSLSSLQWQLSPGLLKLVLDPQSHIRLQPQE